MSELMKKFYTEMLLYNGVDIHNKYYKTSEEFIRIKNSRMIGPGNGMSLEEFIERFLLSEQEVEDTYDSIYDMGNPHILTDDECSDISIAEDIEENIYERDSIEIIQSFHRAGGLIARLKTYLDFDLELFDKNNRQYNAERCKILYMFYMLEHRCFPKTNILMLLNKPSMESIDNLCIGIKTPTGIILKTIKDMLEKELSLQAKENIKNLVAEIVAKWDNIIENAYKLVDFFNEKDYKYDFDDTIRKLTYGRKNTDCGNSNRCKTQSPIEALYLKITQYEYLGNIKDISIINSIDKSYEHNISPELIREMKKLHYKSIDINNIEHYVSENAKRLSKYVYLDRNASSDDIKRIRNAIHKIPKWFDFCCRARSLLDIKEISNELQVVSFLQAVLLDDPNETFDYIFHGYQKNSKHPKRVNAALKNNDYVPQALQCYWVRKVVDRWYANIGNSTARINGRKFEKVCDNILLEILTESSPDEMLERHWFYLDRVNNELLTTHWQIQAVQELEQYLLDLGFKYIDHYYLIRYIFLFPSEIKNTYKVLTRLIKDTIVSNKPVLSVTVEASSANGQDKLEFRFNLHFIRHECILQSFDFNPIEIR